MYTSALTWEIVDDLMAASEWLCCRTGSPRAIGARSLISSRMVSRSLIFCGRMWILPWREAASKMRIPGRYSADHPRHSRWRIRETRRHESSSFLLILHSHIASFRPHFEPKKPHLNDPMESKWTKHSHPCHSRACIAARSRKVSPERWFLAMPMTFVTFVNLSGCHSVTIIRELNIFSFSEWQRRE